MFPVGGPMCSERIRLSQAIDQAAKEVDGAKADQDLARLEEQDIGPSTTVLNVARKQARRILAALDQHRKEHGC